MHVIHILNLIDKLKDLTSCKVIFIFYSKHRADTAK